jgi:hypothetical protein
VLLPRGTDRLVTAWIPFGEVRVEDGALMAARCSHRSEAFAHLRATYGASQVGGDGTRSGWLTDDAAALPSMLTRMGGGDDGGDDDQIAAAAAAPAGATIPSSTAAAAAAAAGGSVPEVDWRTAHFQPGDVAVLTIDTVHMSAANCSAAAAAAAAGDSAVDGVKGGAARVRVSCDTRWQPARERSDPRLKLWRIRGGANQLRPDGREVTMM